MGQKHADDHGRDEHDDDDNDDDDDDDDDVNGDEDDDGDDNKNDWDLLGYALHLCPGMNSSSVRNVTFWCAPKTTKLD